MRTLFLCQAHIARCSQLLSAFLVIDHHVWVHRVKIPSLFEVVSCRSKLLQTLEREGSTEICMSILGVPLDDFIEICNRLFVVVYHLVGFGTFVDIPNLRWYSFDAFGVGEYRLFELLEPAVRETDVVENVGFEGGVRP